MMDTNGESKELRLGPYVGTEGYPFVVMFSIKGGNCEKDRVVIKLVAFLSLTESEIKIINYQEDDARLAQR